MSAGDEVRDALRTLKLRAARGEITHEQYESLRQDLLADLTPAERAELGASATPVSATPTPGPTPHPATPFPLGPSGGKGQGVATRIASLSDLDLRPGSVLFGKWRIEKELGRGGFGVVVEAEELRLRKRQAVKVLDPTMVAREDLLERFRREVNATRELVHARIVRVFDYDEDLAGGLALFSMELVKGCSVQLLLAAARETRTPVPVPLALTVLLQVLEALEAAHAQGVIHRDVTPANVLLAGGGARDLLADPSRDPQVKLVDFGIAGALERSELSQKSRVLGTAAYVAPEVLDPRVEVTPAADVYGAGAVFYELLTGEAPLGRFEDPARLRPEVGRDADALALSLLQRQPGSRPAAKAARETTADVLAEGPRRREEERRRAEDERRRQEELRRRAEEAARLEEQRRETERKRQEEAARRAAAERAAAEEALRAEQAREFEAARKPEEDRQETARLADGQSTRARQGDEGQSRQAMQAQPAVLERAWQEREARQAAKRARSAPPPADLVPGSDRVPAPLPAPPRGALTRAVDLKLIALIVGIAVVAGGVTGVVLWSKKAKIEQQAAVDEVREREVRELKQLMEDGNRLLRSGYAEEALAKFQEVVRRNPDSAAAREASARLSAEPTPEPPKVPSAAAKVGWGRMIRWVDIPAGTFTMGCTPGDAECADDEKPAHRVTLTKGFRMAATETTNEEYRACMEAGACTSKPSVQWFDDVAKRNHPVVSVSWKDAEVFCRGVGGRLPTEAEWEYAAKGGRDGNRYPWDNDIDSSNAMYKRKGRELGPGPVGSYAANGFGLFDMGGNVWEWCADWYDEGYYPKSPSQDPKGPPSGSRRVVRGGCWNSGPVDARVSNRYRDDESFMPFGLCGFRCVQDVSSR